MTDEHLAAITDLCLLARPEDLLGFYLESGFSAEEVVESLFDTGSPG